LGGNIKRSMDDKKHCYCYTYGAVPSLNWPMLDNFEVTPIQNTNLLAFASDNIQVASLGNQPIGDEGVVYIDQENLYPTFCYDASGYNFYDGCDSLNNGAYAINNDVMYAATTMIKMMTDYGFPNPLGKKIGITRLYTHVADLENAYAVKENKSEQGSWHQQAIIGNGGDNFYPLATADIIAHELGHLFTDHNSELIYDGQSGGINEAFSDMVGIALIDYMNKIHPWYTNNWSIGWMVTKEDGHYRGSSLRYIDEPMKDSSDNCPKFFPKYGKKLCSISNASDYYKGIDVHYSSGVYNKAFYLLSTSLGSIKTAFTIFAKANVAYWVKNSDFNHASCGVIKAAHDICDKFCEQKALEAFSEVGVYCPAYPKPPNYGH
jgi:pseudolysin